MEWVQIFTFDFLVFNATRKRVFSATYEVDTPFDKLSFDKLRTTLRQASFDMLPSASSPATSSG